MNFYEVILTSRKTNAVLIVPIYGKSKGAVKAKVAKKAKKAKATKNFRVTFVARCLD